MEIIKVNCWAGNRKGDDFGTIAEKLSTMFLIKRHFIVLSLLVCFHFGQRGFLHFPECLSTPPPPEDMSGLVAFSSFLGVGGGDDDSCATHISRGEIFELKKHLSSRLLTQKSTCIAFGSILRRSRSTK